MSYDDDRPGMMRVHIAQRRGEALAKTYTRNALRDMARGRGIPVGGGLKHEIAWRLAVAGVVAPGYDKAAER